MPIIGFNFDKILVEKTGIPGSQINVKHNLQIKDVERNELGFGGKEKKPIIKFTFLFSVDYEPKLGAINLIGNVLYLEEEKKVKEILDKWKNEKKIETNLSEVILNNILFKCNVKSLSLTQDVGLPPHFNLPRLAANAKTENYIG